MADDLKIWPRLKRLMEYISADPAIREAAVKGDEESVFRLVGKDALSAADLKEAISGILAYQYPNQRKTDMTENRFFDLLCAHDREIINRIKERYDDCTFRDPGMDRFNHSLYARTRVETPLLRSRPFIRYYPVMFELSEGCSVHCFFCALDAGRLQKNFLFTPQNEELFRGVLEVTRELIGDMASSAACYLSTEPLDNPDYEKFLLRFKEIFGYYPQTTTAAAERDPKRMRGFMEQLGKEEMEHHALRFSVRSLQQFRQIMDLYTPEELEDVELLFNHMESDTRFSDSGRVRMLPDHVREKLFLMNYSIVCLAGLCVNFASGTLRWIEPEVPCDEYPLGYRILEETSFQTVEEYRQ